MMMVMFGALTKPDVHIVLEWCNAPEVRHRLCVHYEIMSEESSTRYQGIQIFENVRWFAYRNTQGDPIGVFFLSVAGAKQGVAFIGGCVKPDAKLSVGYRMGVAVLELVFDEMELEKISWEILSSNHTMVNLYQKLGFSKEGVFRQQYFDETYRVDVLRLGLLASEWTELHQRLNFRIRMLDALVDKTPTCHRTIVMFSDDGSWMNPYIEDLLMDWEELGYTVYWMHDVDNAPFADFCFCLSFGKVVPQEVRKRYLHTLVVHGSDLPEGKGWSPLSWQILEGKNCIPVTLLEAAQRIDSGVIYSQRWIEYRGDELIGELRGVLANAELDLCRRFVDKYPKSAERATKQSGKESFYLRRRPSDSQLDPNSSIAEQMNLLRIVDNDRYPAFFELRDNQYRIEINKIDK